MRGTMNHVETQLDRDRFIRIHRSTIVQANRISELVSLDNREFIVRLADGTVRQSNLQPAPRALALTASYWFDALSGQQCGSQPVRLAF